MEKYLTVMLLFLSIPLFFILNPGIIIGGVLYIALIIFAIYFICK